MGAPKNFYNAVDLEKFGLTDITGDVDSLKTVVGDEDSGLVKDVNDLKTTVGNSDSGLVKTVNDLDVVVDQAERDIEALQNAKKTYVGTFEADTNPITVTIAVDSFTADSLIDVYPDISHIGVTPTSVSFTTIDDQAYINIVIPAQTTAGNITVVIWG